MVVGGARRQPEMALESSSKAVTKNQEKQDPDDAGKATWGDFTKF